MQMIVAMEEMAELQKEISKYIRETGSIAHIAEEIADVSIMLEQMVLVFDCQKRVQTEREYKVQRLERRLENHEK